MKTLITPEIATNLDVIGDRWTLLILRDLFVGRNRFEALAAHTGAGRATLTRRLVSLVENQVIEKVAYSRGRFEYVLAEKGLDLLGAAMLAWSWEQTYFSQDETQLPQKLVHAPCGHALVAKAVCGACNSELQRSDVRLAETAGDVEQQLFSLRTQNKQRKRRQSSAGSDSSLKNIAELVGDRWSILILVAMFFGVSQFDQFQKLLGIAPNILGERLNLLVEGQVVKKVPYQQKPVRYQYLLTTKGENLYGFVMAVWQWAMTWADMSAAGESNSVLLHASCEQTLAVAVHCGVCNLSLTLNNLRLN